MVQREPPQAAWYHLALQWSYCHVIGPALLKATFCAYCFFSYTFTASDGSEGTTTGCVVSSRSTMVSYCHVIGPALLKATFCAYCFFSNTFTASDGSEGTTTGCVVSSRSTMVILSRDRSGIVKGYILCILLLLLYLHCF